MKKYFFAFILSVSFLVSSFGGYFSGHNRNITETVKQFILENKLPIAIGDEIIFYGDIDTADRIKFQVFILNLLNIITKHISGGFFYSSDEISEKIIELHRILTAFYNHCAKNNLELAIIINNFSNQSRILVDFLTYHEYDFVDYNGLIILDNNSHNNKLSKLIGFLFQINMSAKYNLLNYFSHGLVNEYFDMPGEMGLMVSTNNIIGDLLFIFSVRNYNLPEFENMWNEIIEKNDKLLSLIEKQIKL